MHYRILKLLGLLSVLALPLQGTAEKMYKPFRPLYFKLGHGMNHIMPTKLKEKDFSGKRKPVRRFPSIEAAFGFQLDDLARAELAFNYYFLFESNEISTNEFCDIYETNYKTKVSTAMINLFADLYTTGDIAHFVGGGLGISRLKDKSKGTIFIPELEAKYELEPANSKIKNRFAYRLTTGISYNICPDFKAEIAYNFFDLGRSELTKQKYQIHNLTLGIKYLF